MILTTQGARTDQERVAVVTYTRDGDRYVIAASKSGAPTNPHWFHNLKANPEVEVEAGGERFLARATVPSGDERDRLSGAARRRASRVPRVPQDHRPGHSDDPARPDRMSV